MYVSNFLYHFAVSIFVPVFVYIKLMGQA